MALKYSDNYSLLETTDDMDHDNTHSVEICVKALEDKDRVDYFLTWFLTEVTYPSLR